MVKFLVGMVLAWPVFALVIHLFFLQKINRMYHFLQATLTVVWLLLTLVLLLNTNLPQVIMLGSWPAPFGIALLSDRLSNVMLLVFAIVATCINFYSYQDAEINSKKYGFYAGFWLLLLAVSGASLTTDIFNLYVCFEVILVSSFVLLASCRQPKYRAIMHYAVMNILGTLLMLLAVALIYGMFGTLNYAGIAHQLTQVQTPWFSSILVLLLFAIGLKGAAFPCYFWLPKAYPKTSTSAIMLLSSLVTKVVMLVLLRLAWLWPPIHKLFLSHDLVWIALATMFFGVIGAASQFRFKAILTFHVISQLGYILLAIMLPLPAGIIAAVYFLIHNIFVKTNLFMICGVLEQHEGTDDCNKLHQVLKHHKWLAIGFFLAAMSLAGFPPLSGFWGKFLIIKVALKGHFYVSAAMMAIVSLLTLYSMTKIWRYAFCESATVTHAAKPKPLPFLWGSTIAILSLLLLSMGMGLWPDAILQWLQPIAKQLSQPNHYIQLVLGAQA